MGNSSSPAISSNACAPLVDWAKQAIVDAETDYKNKPRVVDPNSNEGTSNQIAIDVAKKFLANASPEFLNSPYAADEDRLVKVGKSVSNLLDLFPPANNNDNIDSENGNGNDEQQEALSHIVQQCQILATDDLKVPKVRFGKTEIQMPVVTLGTMRLQQTWGQNINDMDQVNADGQANLVNILRHAIVNLGITHIETARAYGSSEIQLGPAIKQVLEESKGKVTRKDLIIQTKVNTMAPKDFRDTIDKSLRLLDQGYIDLFSFHGLNMDWGYDLIFKNPSGGENLIDIVKEYQAAGKIKHIGFSSHGQPEFIRKCIETGAFEYANIHYHSLACYTAAGGGNGDTEGLHDIVELMNKKDMGVFIISPYDKAGRLYAPSRKLRSLTLPDLEPMQYESAFYFLHDLLDKESSDANGSGVTNAIHTQTVGAARPSDLDEPAVAAYLYANKKEEMLTKVKNVVERLKAAEVEALGEEWVENWHVGVPNCLTIKDPYNFGQMVSLHNIIKAFGLWEYAKERYGTFDGNLKKWDWEKPNSENIMKLKMGWGYMPGIAIEEGRDFSAYLENVPAENKEKVIEAIHFTHKYCSSASSDKGNLDIPTDWEEAYDARAWTAFPERR